MPREFQTSAKQRLIDEFAVFDQEKQETIWSVLRLASVQSPCARKPSPQITKRAKYRLRC